MIEIIHDLLDFVVNLAESDWAIVALLFISVAEAIFFPIPPDPLLIGIALAQQSKAIWMGISVALASVLGAALGHWVGNKLGRPVLSKLFHEKRIQQAENLFEKYGTLATLVAAFTPIPYKIVVITAGALQLDKKKFLVASLVGRSMRYATLGFLIYLFGHEIKSFISNYFPIITGASGIAIILVFLLWKILTRRKNRTRTIEK